MQNNICISFHTKSIKKKYFQSIKIYEILCNRSHTIRILNYLLSGSIINFFLSFYHEKIMNTFFRYRKRQEAPFCHITKTTAKGNGTFTCNFQNNIRLRKYILSLIILILN